MRVTIMMGASGSGKSTYVRDELHEDVFVCSADAFPGLYNEDGSMNFHLLGEAHNDCMRRFIMAMNMGYVYVVVDNTNTTPAEIAPYIAVARAFGREPNIVHVVEIDLPELVERNVHGVPEHVIARQLTNLAATLDAWPPFWPKVTKYTGA